MKYFHVFLLLFFVAGCSGYNSSGHRVSVFEDSSNGDNYSIEIPNRESPPVEPPQKNKHPAPVRSSLSQKIKYIKLISDEFDEPISFQITVDQSTLLTFKITAEEKISKELLGQRYELEYFCALSDCSRAWLLLKEYSSGLSAEIQFEKSIKYFNKKQAESLKSSSEDKALLLEAALWGYPIEHHQAQITNDRTIDLLIIERPEPDNEDLLKLPELPARAEIITVKDAPPSPAQKPDITLSNDPKDAYDIDLPDSLFNKGTVITDQVNLGTQLSIIPAEKQKPTEPAYRMFVIAQEFIRQGIKIKEHACNYYVRAVMNLSGYPSVKSYRANDFHLVFKRKTHNLNTWARRSFSIDAKNNYVSRQQQLLKTIQSLKEEHAFIFQSIEPNMGHVAIYANVKGQIWILDSSRNDHGPKLRKGVKPSAIIFSGRENVSLFTAPGL